MGVFAYIGSNEHVTALTSRDCCACDIGACMSLSTAKYLFVVVGAILLLGGLIAYGHTASFARRASRAQGTVTALLPHLSTDTSNTNGSISNPTSRYTYQPVVQFQHGAQQIQFSDSVASSPPAYRVGDSVIVLYLESNPYDARIESFMSLWFLPLLFGGMGAIFLAIGVSLIFGSRPSVGQRQSDPDI